jgi:Glyoxalase-like domain
MSRTIQVTFDCADPHALAGFWNEALGYRYDSPPPGFATWEEALDHFGVPEDERNNASAAVDPDGEGPRLWFQKVPEGTRSVVTTPDGGSDLVTVKNKLHLDVRAAPGLEGDERMAALESECDRLVALGATRVKRFEPDPPMSHGYIVMEDPEGNVFCLD